MKLQHLGKMFSTNRSTLPEMFLGKGVLQICRKIYRRTLMLNFIEITLWHRCSPVNLLHIFRTRFPKNTSRWLLLDKVRELSKIGKVQKSRVYLLLRISRIIYLLELCICKRDWALGSVSTQFWHFDSKAEIVCNLRVSATYYLWQIEYF